MYYYCTRNVPSRVKKNRKGREFMITKSSSWRIRDKKAIDLCLALRGPMPSIALSKE